ncbi:DUF6385 domain-containing protein [Anaerovorax sp. IOR16]|uniref:DUF6385 domain-containing protein n=1 Tax=Anaerovorax sp. IOR16 TaxID=2773458 RepID=UPI0019D1DD4B|nr:DUF6385 domain-containing protein [Anaerovorax sp. IOR16]
MRILQINPIEIKSFARHCDNIINDTILVGKGSDCIYFNAELTFLPFITNPNETIVRATLKMYCKKIWGNHNPTVICINSNNVGTMIFEKGYYEWDVTNIIKTIRKKPFDLRAYTNNQSECCSIKEFEPFYHDKKPILEVFLETVPPDPSHRLINIIEDCVAREHVQYCNWMDCSSMDDYTYFIQNLGHQEVEIDIQISPDKNMICNDSGPTLIKPNEVVYQEPLRTARYVRVSYKTISSSQPTPIKVWYQGKE